MLSYFFGSNGQREMNEKVEKSADKMGKPTPVDDLSIPRTLRQSSSLDYHRAVSLDTHMESKVLVLYTGGTIGMIRNSAGVLVPEPNMLEKKIRENVTIHDEQYSRTRFGDQFKEVPLVLPNVSGHKRIVYTIFEYDPLLDSSNMTMDDWIQVATDIKKSYHLFDGFVIMHGTDTMAYTSSALSFMLENLGKSVVVTGSQIPCFETRTDGRDNFVGALILAGNYCIPEVSVYFNHKLLRGNRTKKMSAGSLQAFESPNYPALATAGILLSVDYKSLWKPGTIAPMTVQENLCRDVVLLGLFPSIRTETVKHFLDPPIKGVVLQCYGAGNMPSNRGDILEAIAAATARGVIIISCTQCSHGAVSGTYETGKTLIDAGVIQGSDITPEAALTKLAYVLGKEDWSLEERRKAMQLSIRGEMTVKFEHINPRTLEVEKDQERDLDLIEQVASAMNLSSDEEIGHLKGVLFPSLLCSVVHIGSLERLTTLESYKADYSAADYDGRTPLHVAASKGAEPILKWLLERGASVHARDFHDETPMMSAVIAGNVDCVRTLKLCGGASGLTPAEMANRMVQMAGEGKEKQIVCLLAAGASVNVSSSANQNTPLHAALEGNYGRICKLLMAEGASLTAENIYGQTPEDIAKLLNREHLLSNKEGSP